MRVYWVNKHLAFGSIIKTQRDVDLLHGLGITHVINLLKNRNGKKIRRFDSLWLPFRDDKKPPPKWFYNKALNFHKRAFRKKGSKLLVMCYHGPKSEGQARCLSTRDMPRPHRTQVPFLRAGHGRVCPALSRSSL